MAGKEFSQTDAFREFQAQKMREGFYDQDAEHGTMHNFLPFSDLSYWIQEDDLIDQVCDKFPLYRLGGVRQLSFLSYEIGGNGEYPGIKNEFNHDRFDHSLAVGMVIDNILQRNNASSHERTLGVIAGMIHDIATPAGGDATKHVDPQNLHEEYHWQKVLTPEAIDLLNEKDISIQQLDSVIKNEGTLGEVLDIADRLTYTMKDVLNLVGLNLSTSLSIHPARDVLNVLNQDRMVGNIYRDVLIDEETSRPYFNDPGRLERFLKLRALMHHTIYMDPTTSGRNLLLSEMVKPFYSPGDPTDERPLTPALLRQWGDMDLIKFLSGKDAIAHLNPNALYFSFSRWDPQYFSFPSLEQAEVALAQLKDSPDLVTLGITQQKPFDTGENYLTKSDGGEILPFKDVNRDATEYLRTISQSMNRFNVFYTSQDDLSEASIRAKNILYSTP